MKLTRQRAAAVRKVINDHRLIIERAQELTKRGYNVQTCSLLMGRAPVGKIHEYKKSCRLQIGAPSGYMRYAWVVVFDPLSTEKINELNKLYFSGESV